MPDVKLDGFRTALKAAILGPDKKKVRWTTAKYTFNVEKTKIKKTATGIVIDGSKGEHISHRRTGRPDDRIYYRVEISNDGDIDFDMNRKSSWSILWNWFKTGVEIATTVFNAYQKMTGDEKTVLGEARKEMRRELDKKRASSESREEVLAKATPALGSEGLLDGDWESQVEFLIVNIAHYVALLYLPDLADDTISIPDPAALSNLTSDFQRFKANLVVIDH